MAYNHSHSPFLRLPTELRQKLYRYRLVAQGPIRHKRITSSQHSTSLYRCLQSSQLNLLPGQQI